MASRLNPYLQFRDQARQAMTFYQEVFGGDLTISTFGDLGGQGDGVMLSQLEASAAQADMPDGFSTAGSTNAYSQTLGDRKVTAIGEVPRRTVRRIASSLVAE